MDTETDFFIVGIGTSAGGLEALEQFFTNMPPYKQLAFVVVQHLSPDYESHMVELLGKYTSMKVHEVSDGMKIEPENIYLIPRRKNMTVFKGKLYLVTHSRNKGLNLPIDIFFESLAKDQGEKSIGIILSGTGSDGTRGIRAIKEMGGMVMAQDSSAKFDGMPRSAVSTQLVDYIASPQKMPDNLLSYIKHPCLNLATSLPSAIINDQVPLEKLFALLKTETDIDFSDYKQNTILRRISRRMSINQIDDLKDYVNFLEHTPAECQTLYKEFLIGVTRFFRDPEAFEIIKQDVIPKLFKGKKPSDQIRVWVPGCSTGEEAYSLAILFQEYIQETGQYLDVKIFATDIDQEALSVAGRGIYSESILADVSVERLGNFFVKRGDKYEILRHVRSSVVFAHQNLIKDPPFSKMDLISCRNLLIYLQMNLQKKVLELFQFALKPQGYMMLGSSETVGEFADAFTSHNNRWRIFRYEGDNLSSPRNIIIDSNYNDLRPVIPPISKRTASPNWRSSDSILRNLVEQVMPPCVVIDEKQVVIHAFGDVRQYLEAPIGYQVNLNIMNMIRSELNLPLSTALHRILHNEEEVTYNNIHLNNDSEDEYINLTTRLFLERNNRQRLVLIIFEKSDYYPAKPVDKTEEHFEHYDVNQSAVQRIEDLEYQLQYTNENLQATIEELETSNEELQATNEELLAANEELQSTNEELQSVNEELTTVNNEYQLKIKELTQLNNDINNMFGATDVGIIFLDTKMMVRRFTPAVQQAINLMQQDIDRPFKHISNNLLNIDVHAEAHQVLKNKSTFVQEIESRDGQWYIIKISPYLTQTAQTDGVVVSLINITHRKQTEQEVGDYRNRLEIAMQAGKLAWWELDIPTGKVAFNHKKTDMLGRNADDFSHYTDFMDLIHPEDYERTMQAMQLHLDNKKPTYQTKYRIRHQDGSYKWYHDIGQLVAYTPTGKPLTITGFTINITESKHAQEKAQQYYQAQAKLLRNQTILSQTQQMANIGHWELNLKTNKLTWSDEVYRIFNLSMDEFAGTYNAFLDLVHPDDRKRVDDTYQNAIKKQTPYHITHRIQLADGTIKQVSQWGENFFDDNNQPTHSTGLIKEQSESDDLFLVNQFQQAVSISEDAFVITDPNQPDNPVIYVNSAFEKITGYSANEIVNKNMRLLHKSDKDQPGIEELRQAIKSGRSSQAVLRNYRKDGSMFLNKVTIYPLKNSTNQIIRWIGIQQEIIEQV